MAGGFGPSDGGGNSMSNDNSARSGEDDPDPGEGDRQDSRSNPGSGSGSGDNRGDDDSAWNGFTDALSKVGNFITGGYTEAEKKSIDLGFSTEAEHGMFSSWSDWEGPPTLTGSIYDVATKLMTDKYMKPEFEQDVVGKGLIDVLGGMAIGGVGTLAYGAAYGLANTLGKGLIALGAEPDTTPTDPFRGDRRESNAKQELAKEERRTPSGLTLAADEPARASENFTNELNKLLNVNPVSLFKDFDFLDMINPDFLEAFTLGKSNDSEGDDKNKDKNKSKSTNSTNSAN